VDSTRTVWAGNGFGGQFPMVVPEDDLVVVLNQWSILPGQRSLSWRAALTRVLHAVTDRTR
jgi:hypothetical protein